VKNTIAVVGVAVTKPNKNNRLICIPLGRKAYVGWVSCFNPTYGLIKTYVTKHYGQALRINRGVSRSRQKRGEGNLWQRRFWEHLIRDERDFALHCDYIHMNPVHHEYCEMPQAWRFSSIHRFIAQGVYPPDWGQQGCPDLPLAVWDE
jgi:putative transposase